MQTAQTLTGMDKNVSLFANRSQFKGSLINPNICEILKIRTLDTFASLFHQCIEEMVFVVNRIP